MRSLALAGAAAAAALAVFAPIASGARPLVVRTSVSPAWLYFADTVTARVDVVFDRRAVAALDVRPSFGPWQQLGPARVSSSTGPSLASRSWTFSISCQTFACVPRGRTAQPFHLPPLVVTATAADGSKLKLTRPWPTLEVAGRFLPPALGTVRPTFVLATKLPKPTFRFDPSALALAADVVGGLVIAAALGFAALAVVRWAFARREPIDVRPPLVRALALVRQAQGREPEDRRRAAGLLARTLPPANGGLTDTASEVAWSVAQPSPANLEELAQAVEEKLEVPK
jgi:hypothetical protein